MPAKVTEVGSTYCPNDHTLSTKLKIKLTDSLKATVEHRSSGHAVALSLTGKQFEVAHDFGKKDTKLKYKTKLAGANFSVKQHIPNGKWALVPNPEFELSRSGVLGKHGKLEALYDCLDRVGSLQQTLYAGDDKQHKAWAKLNTRKGPSAGLRSKLQAGPLLHSASASYSRSGGWQLSAKSKLSDGTKVKTSYELASDELKVQAKHTPEPLSEGGATASLTLGLTIPVRKQQDPQVVLGIKWEL